MRYFVCKRKTPVLMRDVFILGVSVISVIDSLQFQYIKTFTFTYFNISQPIKPGNFLSLEEAVWRSHIHLFYVKGDQNNIDVSKGRRLFKEIDVHVE